MARALERALHGQPAQPVTASRDVQLAPPSLRGARVLLVEDNELNQLVATELLTRAAGMKVDVANEGHSALLALEHGQYDMVLMDVQMPDMDGFEATRLIRALGRYGNLPIIAMTAYAMESDRQRCLDAGMNDFVTKPVEPAELFAVLSRWLQRSPSERDATAEATDPARCVDIPEGIRRCLGRKDLYDKVVRRFLAAGRRDPDRLVEALQSDDRKAMGMIVHGLVSTAGTLGALQLSEVARQVQDQVRANANAVTLARLVDEFVRVHRGVATELERYVAGEQEMDAVQ